MVLPLMANSNHQQWNMKYSMKIPKRLTHSFLRVTCDEHSKLCNQMEGEIIAIPLTIGSNY
jgi:hypothetical protein